jgi:hypothetical protein
MKAAIVLSLAFVAHAGATATYDYRPGEFLVIDGGISPDKKFSIVSGENKAGEFGVYLRDAHTKKLIGQLEEVATGLDPHPTHTTHIGRRTPNMVELHRGLTGTGRTTRFIALKIDAHIR